jgi:hypothetical protein
MQKELGAEQNFSEVRARFRHHFAEVFGYSDIEENVDTLSFDAERSAIQSRLEPETRNSELETA